MSIDLGPLAGQTFAAVLFDMDGTLIDSTPAVERSWLVWAGEFGLDPLALRGFHGIPSRGVIEHFLDLEVHDAADRRIRELELADTADITVLPGALDALAVLRDGRAAIATSCTADLAEVRLLATALPAPAVLVTASDVPQGKPAPDPYLLAAQRLGVAPERCLVVEDAPAGLVAGKAAGCWTLALTTTSSAEAMTVNPDADAVVPDLGSVRFADGPDGVTISAR